MFSERVMRLRKAKQLNQKQFAERLGLQKSTVSNWENNNTLPSVEMMLNVANFFHVSLDYLMGRDEYLSDGTNLLDATGLSPQQLAHIQQLIDDLRAK